MAARRILETDRLWLREFDEDDLQSYFVLGSDPAVIRYTGNCFKSIEEALEVLRASPLADYRSRGYGRCACVSKETGEVIGFAGLKYQSRLGEVDLGYRLLSAWWGAGLATEAALAVLNHGFTHLGLERIVAIVHLENSASMRVLEKIGMKYTGTVDFMGEIVAHYAATSGAPDSQAFRR